VWEQRGGKKLTTLSVSRLCSVDERMINENGTVGEMIISTEIRSTLKKTCSTLACPPQIPHDLTCDLEDNEAKFKYLWKTLTNQNCSHDNVKVS
jgi:hypothetical protein